MVEFEPNRAYGFLGNRISDDNLRTEGRKDGQTDREMVNYSMIRLLQVYLFTHQMPLKSSAFRIVLLESAMVYSETSL